MGAHDVDRIVAEVGERDTRLHAPVIPPIYQTSLFTFDDTAALEAAFDPQATAGRRRSVYSRDANPTVELLEDKVAALERGARGRAFSSGMAAVTAAVLSTVRSGDHVLCVGGVYWPARRFFTDYLPWFGISTTFVPGTSVQDFRSEATSDTRLIYLESPTSFGYKLQDIAGVAALARELGDVTVIVDNSWATPINQRPLNLGAHLVVHSMTKYLSGHSDVLAGAVVGDEERMHALVAHEGVLLGGILSPFDAWLVVRGLRTLPLRMAAVQERALAVAALLEAHPRVSTVQFPGLASHPQHALARKQMAGYSGVMSFTLDTEDPAGPQRFLDALQVIRIGISWGGFESLAFLPTVADGGAIEPCSAIRLSVGIEHLDSLQHDISRALDAV